MLASHLAVAIENATLYRETRWYAGLLATLHEIGKETSSILDLDVLLQRLAEIVRRVVDYETFGILLLDAERQELVLRKAVNFGSGVERTRLKVSEGLCGAAVRSREAVLVGDVRGDARYVGLVAETRSELVVPLIHKDRVIGVFDLESPQLDRFSERHVKVLTPLASQVAIAIENARLYDEIVRNDKRLSRELRIAREIQHALFPESSPRGAGWEASAHFRPARELGGDLYDFYDMGEGLLGVATGDVAGKGVPAALYAAFTSGTVRARAFERRTPADLHRAGQPDAAPAGDRGPLLHPRVRPLRLPGALHAARKLGLAAPVPLPGRARARRAARGFRPPARHLRRRELRRAAGRAGAGDAVVFYSDGVIEARRGREEYGPERLCRGLEANALRARRPRSGTSRRGPGGLPGRRAPTTT